MDNAVQTLHICLAHAAYVGFRDYNYQDRDWGKYRKWREGGSASIEAAIALLRGRLK